MEVNKKQLADIFGASIRTIQNWQEQGMPVLRGGGKGIRSVNTVGKSAFVESVGRASDDAEGYLDFFKGKISVAV